MPRRYCSLAVGLDSAKPLRYYQEIAINEAVRSIVTEEKRTLLTLCTGEKVEDTGCGFNQLNFREPG